LYYGIRLSVVILWLAGLVAGAWWSLRLARADALFRRSTPEAVAEVGKLAPGNSAYQSLRALQIEYANGDPTPLWRQMTERRPSDATFWILLGLREEVQGRFDEAEQTLLRAAAVNAQYEPRWTLANFYFRRGRVAEFRRWATAAMDRCTTIRGRSLNWGARIDDAPLEVPPALRGAYGEWLIETKRIDAAVAVAGGLRPIEDRASILSITDALIASRPADALLTWSKLGFTPSPDFQPLLGPRIRLAARGSRRNARCPHGRAFAAIVFDGTQTEISEILSRVFVVEPGVRYRWRWQSRTSAARGFAGFVWRVGETSAPISASDSWARWRVRSSRVQRANAPALGWIPAPSWFAAL